MKEYLVKKREWLVCGRKLLTLCALWGWWGMLYPEFTLTEDTYCIVYEEDAVAAENRQETQTAAPEVAKEKEPLSAAKDFNAERPDGGMSARELYQRLLQAPKGQVRFRSKLLLQLQKWMEQ